MKVVIEYDLKGKTPVQKSRILRTMFGFTDKSNFGKYEYSRPGVISKIPDARQIKGAIVVEEKNKTEVVRELKKLNVKPKVLNLS